MRVAINIEFTDEEIKKHAEDVARRVGVNFIHDAIKHARGFKTPPGFLESLVQAVAGARGEKPSGSTSVPESPLNKCAHTEQTRTHDEFWLCCQCGTDNIPFRPTCRHCGHERCDDVGPHAPHPPSEENTA